MPILPRRTRADFARSCSAIYDDLEAEIRRLGPSCGLSGLCCRFKEYDHVLFVSAPEAALLLADAPPPVRALDDGATCPWQDENGRCSARDARPLGCRIFFCDPSYEAEMPALSEDFIGRLKGLADRLGLPWDYAPLHYHLARARRTAIGARPVDVSE